MGQSAGQHKNVEIKTADVKCEIFHGKFDLNSSVGIDRGARKRIYHECEVLIYKSVPRVTVWDHSAEPRDAKL